MSPLTSALIGLFSATQTILSPNPILLAFTRIEVNPKLSSKSKLEQIQGSSQERKTRGIIIKSYLRKLNNHFKQILYFQKKVNK